MEKEVKERRERKKERERTVNILSKQNVKSLSFSAEAYALDKRYTIIHPP